MAPSVSLDTSKEEKLDILVWQHLNTRCPEAARVFESKNRLRLDDSYARSLFYEGKFDELKKYIEAFGDFQSNTAVFRVLFQVYVQEIWESMYRKDHQKVHDLLNSRVVQRAGQKMLKDLAIEWTKGGGCEPQEADRKGNSQFESDLVAMKSEIPIKHHAEPAKSLMDWYDEQEEEEEEGPAVKFVPSTAKTKPPPDSKGPFTPFESPGLQRANGPSAPPQQPPQPTSQPTAAKREREEPAAQPVAPPAKKPAAAAPARAQPSSTPSPAPSPSLSDTAATPVPAAGARTNGDAIVEEKGLLPAMPFQWQLFPTNHVKHEKKVVGLQFLNKFGPKKGDQAGANKEGMQAVVTLGKDGRVILWTLEGLRKSPQDAGEGPVRKVEQKINEAKKDVFTHQPANAASDARHCFTVVKSGIFCLAGTGGQASLLCLQPEAMKKSPGQLSLFSDALDMFEKTGGHAKDLAGGATAVAFHPKNQNDITVAVDREIRLLSHRSVEVTEKHNDHKATVTAIEYDADGELMVSAAKGELLLWKAVERPPPQTPPTPEGGKPAKPLPSCKYGLKSPPLQSVGLQEEPLAVQWHKCKLDTHKADPAAESIDVELIMVATASALQLFRVDRQEGGGASLQSAHRLDFPKSFEGHIQSACFNGKFVYCAASTGRVHMWRVEGRDAQAVHLTLLKSEALTKATTSSHNIPSDATATAITSPVTLPHVGFVAMSTGDVGVFEANLCPHVD